MRSDLEAYGRTGWRPRIWERGTGGGKRTPPLYFTRTRCILNPESLTLTPSRRPYERRLSFPSRVPVRHGRDLRAWPRVLRGLADGSVSGGGRASAARAGRAGRLPVRVGARLPADGITGPDAAAGDGADERRVEGAGAQPELLRIRCARARDGRRASERGALPRLQDRGARADAVHDRRDEHGGAGAHLRGRRSRAHDGSGASRRSALLGLRRAAVRRGDRRRGDPAGRERRAGDRRSIRESDHAADAGAVVLTPAQLHRAAHAG